MILVKSTILYSNLIELTHTTPQEPIILLQKLLCVAKISRLNEYFKLGYELLRVLLPPRENFVDYVFHKAYHLTGFLKHVSPLATGALGCYSVLITLPVIF